MRTALAVVGAAGLCGALAWSTVARGQGAPGPSGEKLFAAACVPCHGRDGDGGERGPSILEPRRAGSRTRAELKAVIKDGIPAAGMPPFALPERELEALTAYVSALIAPAIEHAPAGDVAAGQRYFFGKGDCVRCHSIRGRGGHLGPPLSNLGRQRSLARIEQALRQPGARKTPGYAVVSLRARNGKTVRGLLKNESNHDMQVLSLDGALHLLDARDITSVRREPASLMPPVRAEAAELRDLLAYLARLSDAGTATLPAAPPAAAEARAFAAVARPAPGDWPTYHGLLGGNRHSPLRQIHQGNVGRLAPRWIFPIPNSRLNETTPLVVGGVMYLSAPNQAFALDARTGRQIWHYARPLTKGLAGDAARGINRGLALLGDRLFMVTDHAHLLALHRATGTLLWEVEMADYRQNYGTTSAPLVVNDLVISGNSGGDEGTRGFIAAYHAATGAPAWRFWTVPAPGEPGAETWKGKAIEHGCAASWLTGSYDVASNLLYWTTGNPCPDYDGDERQGDNLYSNSVLALDPATGKRRWHYQFTPHDLHDWDAAQTPLLVDASFRGKRRQLLAQANRNGFFYLLDRLTGQLLLTRPFVEKLTWATGIGADGRPVLVPDQEPTPQGTKTCPAVEGATNWMSTAADPALGLYYVMALEKCSIYYKTPEVFKPGQSFYGGGTRRVRDEVPRKVLRAIELSSGRIAWEAPQVGAADSWGGVLSTAGGLVFFGDDSGALAAVDSRSGKPRWHFHTNAKMWASPMTYLAGGQQFVAVATGGTVVSFALPP